MTSTLLRFDSLVAQQRQHFRSGATQPLGFRLAQLKRLKEVILAQETDILAALQQDLGKPHFDGYLTEIAAATREIDYAIKHLKQWVKPKRVGISLENFSGPGADLP